MPMTTYVALLRAVNVGGKNSVSMSTLRELLTASGLKDVQTLLQSGNVLFRTGTRAPAKVEAEVERLCRTAFKLDIEVFVRTARDWDAVVANNPFPDAAVRSPGRLLVYACRSVIAPDAVERLQAALSGGEALRASGAQVYATYPDGVGTSRLTGAVIEKALATRGTARNWNTVLKLQASAAALDRA